MQKKMFSAGIITACSKPTLRLICGLLAVSRRP